MQRSLILIRYYQRFEGVMAVDLSQARQMYKDGALKAAIVAPAPMMPASWVLMVERTDGSLATVTLARSEAHKVYSTLGAAHADARRIGFVEVRTLHMTDTQVA
nr:hypothetical protein [Pseudomonas syringae pv. actinidiae]